MDAGCSRCCVPEGGGQETLRPALGFGGDGPCLPSLRRALLVTPLASEICPPAAQPLCGLCSVLPTPAQAQSPPSAQAPLYSKSKCRDHVPLCVLDGAFICLTDGRRWEGGPARARQWPGGQWRKLAELPSRWASQRPEDQRGSRSCGAPLAGHRGCRGPTPARHVQGFGDGRWPSGAPGSVVRVRRPWRGSGLLLRPQPPSVKKWFLLLRGVPGNLLSGLYPEERL